MGRTITIDPNDLTIGEVETIEELVGAPIGSLAKGISGKAAAALVYVIERRSKPDFTLDDARSYKLSDITFGEAEPSDPT